MGTNNLTTVVGGIIRISHPNQYATALQGDVVPRNGSGVPTTEAGSLGSSTYEWLKAFIASGHWSAGDVKLHHSYNSLVGPGQGWMLCDGRTVSEANYDVEHGAGSWDTYVGVSPLDGKFLPDFTSSKYPAGASTTTETGVGAIATTGNSGNTINIQHTHTIADHQHKWYDHLTAATDQVWDGNGTAVDIPTESDTGLRLEPITGAGATSNGLSDAYTREETLTPANSLSTTQSIQPHSIAMQYYMRII